MLLVLFACKSEKHAAKTTIKNKSANFLLEQLSHNESNYDWLSAKLSSAAEINDKKYSVTIKLRIRSDSAVWMSVSPALGIEMARVLITKDSLKFINRLNSTYFIGSFDYLNRLINADINFSILQALLTGNNFSFLFDGDESDDRFKSSIDGDKYLLSTAGKRKPRTASYQKIWLDPDSFKVSKLEISDFSQDGRMFEVNYSEFKKVDNQVFPHNINFYLKNEHPIRGSFSYSKISINEPQEFPFTIPEKYEQIK